MVFFLRSTVLIRLWSEVIFIMTALCKNDVIMQWCSVYRSQLHWFPSIPLKCFFFLFFFCFALAPVPLCSEKQPGLEQRSLGSLVPRNTPGLVRAQPSDLYKLTVLEVQINVVSGKAQFKLEPCCFLKSYHVHRNPTPLSGRTNLFLFNIKITLQDLEKKKEEISL